MEGEGAVARAATLEGLGQASPDDGDLFPGVSAEMVARIRRMMAGAVADGIDTGVDRAMEKHGTMVKVAVGASVVSAVTLLIILAVLLAKD